MGANTGERAYVDHNSWHMRYVGNYYTSTQRFTESRLVKLGDSGKAVGFRLELIFATAQATSNNATFFKSGQKKLETNHFTSLD